MNSKKILYKIIVIEKDYNKLKKELENHKILKSKENFYLKEDKESFKKLWNKYIDLFSELEKLIKYSKYRSYFFFIKYDKIVLRKYILSYYYNIIIDLEHIFWEHKSFLRIYIKENFKKDYWYFVNYIYRPNFINLINTPNIFIRPFKKYIKPDIYSLLSKPILNTLNFNRVNIDYNNLYFYTKYWFDRFLFNISKYIWYKAIKIRFTKRKRWLIKNINIKKYLEIAKPWDILLTRLNWTLSDISIPWFWKHMSMYLWKWKFLKENFSFSFLKDLDNNTHYIIEATLEWIQIVSIYDLIWHNDYFWASRTTFNEEKIYRAIKNSLENLWKWYDYRFNFYSDTNLVCSELVLKSYAKEFEWDVGIEIELESIWISFTFPPNNFVYLLNNLQEKKTNNVVFPVFFIDSIEKTWENFISTLENFLESRNRSRNSLFLK